MSDAELSTEARQAVEKYVREYLGKRLLAFGTINAIAVLSFAYQFFVALPESAARAGSEAAQQTVNQMSVQSEELRSLSQAAYARTRQAQENVGAVTILLGDIQRQAKDLDDRYRSANAADSAGLAQSINALRTLSPAADQVLTLSKRLQALGDCIKGLRLSTGPTTKGVEYGAASNLGTQPPGESYFMVGIFDGTGTNGIPSYNAYRQLTLGLPSGCNQ